MPLVATFEPLGETRGQAEETHHDRSSYMPLTAPILSMSEAASAPSSAASPDESTDQHRGRYSLCTARLGENDEASARPAVALLKFEPRFSDRLAKPAS